MFDNSKVSDIQAMRPEPRKEGCELVEIKKLVDEKTGASSITFKFVDSTGAELTHREFEPSRQIGTKTLTDEEFKKNVNLTHSRIAHITRAFVPEDKFLLIKVADTGNFRNDWNAYLKITAEALGVTTQGVEAAKGKKCALKVVYRKVKDKFYSSLPNVPPFISTELHPKTFSTNPQYDKYEIERIVPDAEKPVTNLAQSFAPGAFQETPPPSGFGQGGASQPQTNHPSGF